jgi:hypothetical protein
MCERKINMNSAIKESVKCCTLLRKTVSSVRLCGYVSTLKHVVCGQRHRGSLSIVSYSKTLHRVSASISDTDYSRVSSFLATVIISSSHKIHKVKCIMGKYQQPVGRLYFQRNGINFDKTLAFMSSSSDSIS